MKVKLFRWCAQEDDFRTFLDELVAASQQFESASAVGVFYRTPGFLSQG
jgi:hypothetical protein